MRWGTGRTVATCPECGTGLAPDAVWCGTCGAATSDRPEGGPDGSHLDAAVTLPPDEVEEDPATPGRRPWLVAGLAGLAVVALVLAGLGRSTPAEPVLGAVGSDTEVAATGPPPDDLRLAWSYPLPSEDMPPVGVIGGIADLVVPVVAADGLVRVGHHVLDVPTRRLVRVTGDARFVPGGTETRIEAGELLVVDTVTGAVRARTPMGEDIGASTWATGRSGTVTMFRLQGDPMGPPPVGSVLIGDDGAVVAEVDGVQEPWVDRAIDGPVAFPVRLADEVASGSAPFDLGVVGRPALVAPDGTTVAEFPSAGAQVVDVVGGVAMVSSTDEDPHASGTGIAWDVHVVDARTGDTRLRTTLDSVEAPRLLGMVDERAVVATRSGRLVRVTVVAADATATILENELAQGGQDPFGHETSSMLRTAALVGDRVVSLVDDGTRVVAVGVAGDRQWSVDLSDADWTLHSGDGLVALLPTDDRRPGRLLDGADGSDVLRLPPALTGLARHAERWTPSAVVDGHVGIGDRPGFFGGRMLLGSGPWLDLETGAPATIASLFAPLDRETAASSQFGEPSSSWQLLGTVGDPQTGQRRPIVARTPTREVVEVIGPAGTRATFELDVDSVPGDVAGYYSELVGASTERIAVMSEGGFDDFTMTTNVLAPATGELLRVDDVGGMALLEDLLLGVRFDGSRRVSTMVGIDPVTGEERWARSFADTPYEFLATHRYDEDLYVSFGRSRVRALHLADGSDAWVHRSDDELVDLAVLTADHVVVATTTGTVRALDRADGSIAWEVALGTPVTSLSGAGAHVLAGTVDGLVVHLDEDGDEVQRVPLGTGEVVGAVALGDTVVGISDRVVVGLRADGRGITRQDEVDLP